VCFSWNHRSQTTKYNLNQDLKDNTNHLHTELNAEAKRFSYLLQVATINRKLKVHQSCSFNDLVKLWVDYNLTQTWRDTRGESRDWWRQWRKKHIIKELEKRIDEKRECKRKLMSEIDEERSGWRRWKDLVIKVSLQKQRVGRRERLRD